MKRLVAEIHVRHELRCVHMDLLQPSAVGAKGQRREPEAIVDSAPGSAPSLRNLGFSNAGEAASVGPTNSVFSLLLGEDGLMQV